MSDTNVKTGKVRFGYPAVFKPTASQISESDELKYRITVYIRKDDTKTVKDVRAAIQAAFDKGKANAKFVSTSKTMPETDPWKFPLKDGDKEGEDGTAPMPGYWIIRATAREDRKPGLVGPDPNINITSPDEFYAGCYGRITLNFFPFGPKPSKGVSAGINNIQKLSDGKRLDGSKDAVTDFDDGYEDSYHDDEEPDYIAPKKNTSKADDYDDL